MLKKTILLAGLIYLTGGVFAQKSSWQPLFDGKTLKDWEMKNGELSVQKSDGTEATNGGDILTTYGAKPSVRQRKGRSFYRITAMQCVSEV